MKKKLYFKNWVQDALMVYELVLTIALGGVADNLNAPTEYIFIIGLFMIIIAVLLMKYGKFEEE